MDCPICQTKDIPESDKFCPTCDYDLSPYPLATEEIPPKAASTQSRYQINQIVSQVEQLTKVQTQLSNKLAELVSVNMSARFSEIQRELEQRLENLAASRSASNNMSARFSKIQQELEQRLEDLAASRSASNNMSAQLSEIQQKLQKRLDEIAASGSASDKISDSEQELKQELKQRLEKIDDSRTSLDNMSIRLSKIEQELEQLLKMINASRRSSNNMSDQLLKIEQELQERLYEITLPLSQFPDLSEIIEPPIMDKPKEFLSEEMSKAVAQLELWLNSLVTISPQSESTTSATLQPNDLYIGIPLQTFSFTTMKVNDQGKTINYQDFQAKYFTENLGNGVTLDMVAIPGGTFIMGSPVTEKGRSSNEWPQRSVTVPAFFMGKYPVTQQQWQVVMGNNPSYFKGANRPVEQVSWHDAVEFCQKLSQITGKNYRLLSEAEWEYACRAGTTTPFYFGETITTDLANYYGNYTYGNGPKGVYRQQTTDVGSFPPNAFGLYDMHGNVWEWCQDVWHENYNGAPTDGSAWTSGGDSSQRLLRGGNWNSFPWGCRSACRYCNSPGDRNDGIGFRIAVSLPRT